MKWQKAALGVGGDIIVNMAEDWDAAQLKDRSQLTWLQDVKEMKWEPGVVWNLIPLPHWQDQRLGFSFLGKFVWKSQPVKNNMFIYIV